MSKVDKEKQISIFWRQMAEQVNDKKYAHILADAFLLTMLRELGHGDIAEAWEEAEQAFEWGYA